MALSSSGYRKESYILNLTDPSAGWRQVGNLKTARARHTCSHVDKKIVIVGGYDGSYVDIYDIVTEKWSTGKGKTCH